MRRHLFILTLSSLALLAACKPTPRTAAARKDTPATPPPAEAAEAATDQPAAEPPTPEARPAAGLLDIATTRQDYNQLRPWEKKNPNSGEFKGVYLGNGRVLTVGRAARAATYVELSLPDHSRTVPARVVKFDDALGLALLTVEHAEDADLFENLTAHPVGEPLKLGDQAELHTITPNLTPQHVAAEVESVNDSEPLPRPELRTAKPVPMEVGLPILQDGRLVALVDEYDSGQQSVTCINAEFINRFLDESTASGHGVPVLGVGMALLDDPAFRKYLKLDPAQGGIYVSKVQPGSAAQAAGLHVGDVITAVEGLPLDKLGRCIHPIYGLLEVQHVVRSLKPVGQQIKLSIIRDGRQQEISATLNRDAVEKGLLVVEAPGTAPRYVVWGGLVFQPITQNILESLSNPPLSLLELKDRVPELLAEGRQEIVVLTQVIPTPATLSYDTLGVCPVERVNGKRVHSLAEFAELLDTPTEDGLVELTLSRPPYRIYMDRQAAEASNDAIRRRAIPNLRRLGEGEAK